MDIKRVLNDYMPTDYLDKAIESGLSAKEEYLGILNLNKENNYRQLFPLPQSLETLPLARNFLVDVASVVNGAIIDFQYIQVGKQKFRATKLITQHWEVLITCSPFRNLVRDMLECYESKQVSIKWDIATVTCQQFLLAYGEYVQNSLVAVLSANPCDYLILSDSSDKYCKYSSCTRYNDGEYFNTCLIYLNSPSVFVGYTAKPENLDVKVGKAIVYIGGKTTVSTGRVYGSFPDTGLRLIRNYCQDCLDNQISLLGENYTVLRGTIGENNAVNSHCGYIDSDYGIVTVRNGCEIESCNLPDGICLSCGDELNGNENGGACRDCKEDKLYCERCGCGISEDDARWGGDYPYCEDCFNDLFSYCELCDEVCDNDFMHMAHGKRDKEIYVCQHCLEKDFYYCEDCNENYLTAISVKDGDYYVCNNCLENYFTCEDCEIVYPTDELHEANGQYYCKECIENHIEEEAV